MTICPICEAGELRQVIQDEDFTLPGGRVVVLTSIESLVCEACGEGMFPRPERARIEREIRERIAPA